MMKSIALTESNIVDDDSFIMVDPTSLNIMDDDSYVYCDDVSHTSSPLISTGFSHCSTTLTSDIVWDDSTMIVSDGEDEREDDDITNLPKKVEILMPKCEQPKDDNVRPIKNSTENSKKVTISEETQKEIEQRTSSTQGQMVKSRMSNKKRRKKMKLMKKAAAAAAAAEALAQAEANKNSESSSDSDHVEESRSRQVKKSKKKVQTTSSPNANLAVTCATESLADYRDKHNIKKKFGAATNYICLL